MLQKPIFFILILFVFPAFGQEEYTAKIKGIVYSEEDGNTLSFVNISLKNTTQGTISNLGGKFDLYIHSLESNIVILFSAIGYERQEIILDIQENKNHSLEIQLKPQVYQLKELVFHYKEGNELIKRCIENLGKNYPSKLHQLNGYFRELISMEGRYVRLLEAAVQVYEENDFSTKKKLKKKVPDAEVEVLELRKSRNDLYFRKILGYNSLSNLLIWNFIKYRLMIFEEDNLEGYNFWVADTLDYNGRQVYELNFAPVEDDGEYFYNGKLYMDAENYAVIELFADMDEKLAPYQKAFKINSDTSFVYARSQTHLQFKEYKGLHYLSYIKLEAKPVYFLTPAREKTIFDGNLRFEFLANEILTEKVKKPSKKNLADKTMDLYRNTYTYHPEFWEKYTILVDDEIREKALKDLGEQ